ncbi:MAG: hypothetical protein LBW85_07845, partial [Deltaproteobacteria bacterium]|nr:hypothetical protein [Deltaproteobacteria bacterium]
MADERDYLDENGNDLRYGEYIGGDWYPDPPKVIELKKSGVWQTLREIERRWILDANLRPSAAGKAMLDEIAEE